MASPDVDLSGLDSLGDMDLSGLSPEIHSVDARTSSFAAGAEAGADAGGGGDVGGEVSTTSTSSSEPASTTDVSPDDAASEFEGVAGSSEGTTAQDAVDLASETTTTVVRTASGQKLSRSEAADLGIDVQGEVLEGDIRGEPDVSDVRADATQAAVDTFMSGGTGTEATSAATDAVSSAIGSLSGSGGGGGGGGSPDVGDLSISPVERRLEEQSQEDGQMTITTTGGGSNNRLLLIVAAVVGVILAVVGGSL